MFCVLHESVGSTTYRINTNLIAYIASTPGADTGKVSVKIGFSTGEPLKLILDQSPWDKFLEVLHKEDAAAGLAARDGWA
jgi:hypothetical protein